MSQWNALTSAAARARLVTGFGEDGSRTAVVLMKELESDQNLGNSCEISCVSAAGAVKASVAVSPPMAADADLRAICDAWPALPEPIRAAMLALVNAANVGGGAGR